MIKILTMAFAILLVLFLNGCEDSLISLRLMCIHVVTVAANPGDEEFMRPNTIVRIRSQNDMQENFILTNEAGLG